MVAKLLIRKQVDDEPQPQGSQEANEIRLQNSGRGRKRSLTIQRRPSGQSLIQTSEQYTDRLSLWSIYNGDYDFFFFFFLGPCLRHMEVPRLGANQSCSCQPTPQLTATKDPIHIRDLHCSLQQHQILNPLSEARDRICNLTDTMSGS